MTTAADELCRAAVILLLLADSLFLLHALISIVETAYLWLIFKSPLQLGAMRERVCHVYDANLLMTGTVEAKS